MESAAANIHHQHQPQDQHVVGSSSPSLPSTNNPYAYAAASTTNPFLNTSSVNACSEVGIFNSRDSWQQNDLLGFHWASSTEGNSHLARNIKHKASQSSCSILTQVLINSSSSQQIEETHTSNMIKNLQKDPLVDPLNSSTVLKYSTDTKTGYQMNEFQMCPEESNSNYFNQMSGLVNSSFLDMNNLQASNFLSSARFNDGFVQIPRDQPGYFRDGLSYGLDYHMPQSSVLRPIISSPNNITSLSNVVAEAKRSFMMLESKQSVPAEPVPKKSRLVSRASCPPFKVRKEKLGDRIAALQQLVAPFGKTDTASVLMEAIGYIKFLQNQVETLSVPYMQSSRNKARVMQGGAAGNESEDSKQDLRSRGLCLVPLSCLSYVADGGGGVWPPPTFGGGV